MRNKISYFVVLTVALWLNIFHAPHVTAFFDYNKFHPLPYRPDLQEFCPQVSHEQSNLLYISDIIVLNTIELVKENEPNQKKIKKYIIFTYLNIMNSNLRTYNGLFFSFTWTLPFCLKLFYR